MSHESGRELIAELLHAAHVLGASGLFPATDGNLSARLDEKCVLVSVGGIEKRSMREEDLVKVFLDEPRPDRVSTEWPMHRVLYQGRKGVGCVLPVHSPALTAFAAAHRVPQVKLLSESYATVGPIVLVPFAQPGTDRVGEAMLEVDSAASVYLLANHGAVAVGGSPREALYRIERAEFLARVELNTTTLGGGRLLTADQLATLR